MAEGRGKTQGDEFAEEAASLWEITFGPLIWALHFIACYATTAVFCAKRVEADIDVLRWSVGAATLLALGGIARVGRRAWRQWSPGGRDTSDDAPDDAPDDALDDALDDGVGHDERRHRFLGHAAFLLAVVAFIGVVYGGLPALFAATCR